MPTWGAISAQEFLQVKKKQKTARNPKLGVIFAKCAPMTPVSPSSATPGLKHWKPVYEHAPEFQTLTK